MSNNRETNSTQSSVDEVITYMKIFDITLDRDPLDPYVVPERMMHSFTSSTGQTFLEILNREPLFVEKMNYLKFTQEKSSRNRRVQRIPPMDNNMALYIYYLKKESKPPSQALRMDTARLTFQLQDRQLLIQMSKSEIKQQVNQLSQLFNHYFPHYYFEFTPYGSMIQGLGFSSLSNNTKLLNINIEMDAPDMERLVHRQRNPYTEDRDEPHSLQALQPHFLRDSSERLTFKEDLQTFRLKAKSFGVEFNFNKKIFTQSTFMIQQYVHLDPRVLPFISAIKLFVRGRNIISPYLTSGGMRAFGYVVMALAYLQQLDPPVIPNLQHLFDTNTRDYCNDEKCASKQVFWDTICLHNDKRGIAARYHDCATFNNNQQKTFRYARLSEGNEMPYWRSANDSSVGELLIDFFFYYGYAFNYDQHAVSLRAGGYTLRKEEFRGYSLVVEDPFISGLSIAPRDFSLSKMASVMAGAFTMLYKGKSFDEVLQMPDLGCRERISAPVSSYVPLNRLSITTTAKTLVVIDLPRMPDSDTESACLCEELVQLFTAYGSVRDVQDLDYTTKQLTIVTNPFIPQDIIIPSSLQFQGKTIFIVELYDY
ncbi:hypothetical protein EDC96DRAFT_499230 [Choanephora cucurbitarum]|nr:hypothetical protein EDC96DRAFT_499230 [Choanephora cucurbitarum]